MAGLEFGVYVIRYSADYVHIPLSSTDVKQLVQLTPDNVHIPLSSTDVKQLVQLTMYIVHIPLSSTDVKYLQEKNKNLERSARVVFDSTVNCLVNPARV